MRNVIYSIGIASFLACMTFTVATSFTNPFYGMSEAALGQATTGGGSWNCGSFANQPFDPITFNSKGNPKKLICTKYTCTRTMLVTMFKFKIGGSFKWVKYIPGMDISAAIESRNEEHTETQKIVGNEYICDKDNESNCVTAYCY